MNGFKLGQLYIENFKLLDSHNANFTNEDLIVLDGPNGYGKTTLFDTLELLLSGQISRVSDNDVANSRFKYRDVFLAKDSSKPIIIKGEFIKGDKKVVIARKKEGVLGAAQDNNATNWGQYKLYRLNDFDDEINEDSLLLKKELNELFELNDKSIDLSKDFRHFYYIQQENNTQFLKSSEGSRIELLSKFFGTSEAENLKNVINEKINTLKVEQDELEEKITKLTSELNEVDQKEEVKTQKHTFTSLLTNQEWDNESFIPGQENYYKVQAEIQNIKQLILNLNDFKIYLKNRKLEELYNTDRLPRAFLQYIVCSHFIDTYDILNKKYKQYKEYAGYKLLLEKDKFNAKTFNLQSLKKFLEKTSQISKFEEINTLISRINDYQTVADDFQELLSGLLGTRSSLIAKLDEYKKHNDISDCPLCGYDWGNYDKLIDEIDKTTNKYVGYIDTNSKQAYDLIDTLFKEYFNVFQKQINEYLTDSKNNVDEEFFNQLENLYHRDEVLSYIQKLEKLDLLDDAQKLVNEEEKFVNNLHERLDSFIETIKSKMVKIKTKDFYDKVETWYNIYSSSYNNSIETLEKINEDLIERKLEYLTNKYYFGQEERKKSINNNLTKEKARKIIIVEIIKKSSSLSDKLEKKIKAQWKKVINQVAIPLYIYSGKILQNTQRGSGIFMIYDDGKKRGPLKFVASLDTDHDVLYSMSSGQLSGLMIALTLALNKVYGGDGGGALFIDDPVQSMDEINMASFIELMRNEFSETQLMMSTHEEYISNYMHYKFNKYGKNVRRFHAKKEFS